MTETVQPQSQVFVIDEKNAGFPSPMPEKIDEKEKAEYVKTLDDLCAVLENYSAALTKNISKITGHSSRIDKLQINKKNII